MSDEKETRPLCVIDIDGTLFRGTLTDELTAALLHCYHSTNTVLVAEFDAARGRIARRECTYHEYAEAVVVVLRKMLVGMHEDAVHTAIHKVTLSMQGRTHPFTTLLLDEVKESHCVVAITGSPHEVIDPLLDEFGIHHRYGTIFAKDAGVYTGTEVRIPVFDKKKWLDEHLTEAGGTLEGSIGIGDSKSDIAFLDMVEFPIAFNPDFRLLQHALEKKWWIILRADEDSMAVLTPKGKTQIMHYVPSNFLQISQFVRALVRYPHQLMR